MYDNQVCLLSAIGCLYVLLMQRNMNTYLVVQIELLFCVWYRVQVLVNRSRL